MATVLYFFSTNAINEEVFNTNVNNLNYIVKNMEITIRSIDFITSQIALDPNVTYFMRNRFSDDYMRLINLISNMDGHKVINPLIHSIYLYYKGNNAIISSPDGKVEISSFSDIDWIQELTYKNQTQWILNRKIKITSTGKGNFDILTYVRYLPIGSIGPEGALLININVNELYKLYQSSNDNSSGIVVFNEYNNKIFTTINEDMDFNPILKNITSTEKHSGYDQIKYKGRTYAMAYSTSSNGWKYIMTTPISKLMSMQNIIRNIIIACTMCMLIIGLQLSLVFSRRLYNPINNLMNSFQYGADKPGIVDEFGIIERSVNSLIHEKGLLEEKNTKSLNYAVERVVIGVLNGNVMLKALEDFNGDIGIQLHKCNSYMVIVAELDDYKNLSGEYCPYEHIYHIQSLILKKFEDFKIIKDVNFCKGVSTYPYQGACLLALNVIMSDESILLKQVFSICNNIRDEINTQYKANISIGFSIIGKSSSEIYGLYHQACNAVKNGIFQGKNCVSYYGQISFWDNSVFIFPIKQEEAILKSLLSLDRQNVSVSIRDFVEYIKNSKGLEHNQVFYIFAHLLGSITKAAYELGGSVLEVWEGKDMYKSLSQCNYLEDIEELMVSLANHYINYFEEKKSNKYKTIVESAIEYMMSNYANHQISLNLISEKVYLSSSHFEKIFKDITGKSAIDYLNNIRMEKAKALLKDNNLKVEVIAEKVGYTTSRGFIRAFKKYENITPGQYRQNLASNLTDRI